MSAELAAAVTRRRREGALLQRRVVCPVGVDPGEGTGCYEIPDELPEQNLSGPAANDNAVQQAEAAEQAQTAESTRNFSGPAANDNAVQQADAAEQAQTTESTEAAEATEAVETAETAEAAEVAVEAAETAEVAEGAIATGALLEEIPVAGWILGTALIVGGAGYLAYQHFHNSSQPATASSGRSRGRPVMPTGLTQAEQDLWNECSGMHDQYKATQTEYARNASRYNELRDKLENNRATAAERAEFCSTIDALIDVVGRLRTQRLEYVDRGCDYFDWYNEGRTQAEREAKHRAEAENVRRQLESLQRIKAKFCP